MLEKRSRKHGEPVAMGLMIVGLAGIVQPWSLFFHRYGIVLVLAGLVGFIFFSHIKPPAE